MFSYVVIGPEESLKSLEPILEDNYSVDVTFVEFNKIKVEGSKAKLTKSRNKLKEFLGNQFSINAIIKDE